ncbi:MAG TPA: PQQ-binding-like beta-propeller repeat protein, partial [Planctomycetaceae bacterium]|nr:PQQ-binding-like beta-propeller repeat protein [Planctomycetaceae bacterium]
MWSFNGGPADRRILGNNRLVSSWPARGGPVFHDGRLYFSASIWPFMGIFIHCLEPDSGRVVWTNSGDGTNFIVHPHNAPSFGTVVPQGHFAAAGDSLVVPGGRSTPAVYDARTGELRHFAFDKRVGSHAISVRGDTYFVADNTYDRETGEYVAKGEPVVSDENSLLYVSGDRLLSLSAQGRLVTTTTKDRRGAEVKAKFWKPEEQYSSPIEDAPGDVYLRAGDRLYSAGARKVSAYELPAGGKPVWTGEFEGTAVTMLAADGKLFVVDDACRLYCFGTGTGEPARHSLEPSKPTIDERWANRVKQLAPVNRVEQGHALSLGIGSGELIEALLEQTDFFVIAVDPDPARVESFRRKMTAAGLYGRRVSAHRGDPFSFPYPKYVAGLIFSETPDVAELSKNPETIRHLFETLRPYGGAMAFEMNSDTHTASTTLLAEMNLPNAEIERFDGLTKIVRSGALPGSDDWTHQYGDSAQSVVSQDKLVKAPLGLLWYGGPSNDAVLPRHGHGPSPQVAGGRLFIEGPDMLRCVDVYTGRVWWEKSLPGLGEYYDNTAHQPGAGEIGSNYVSLKDHVYVVYGEAILELDATSGQETRRFQLQPENDQPAPNWGYLGVSGDYLVATSDPLDISFWKSVANPKQNELPAAYQPAIKQGDVWKYLAGTDPTGEWQTPEFDDSGWKSGKAGFGYGDNDDATILDMRGKYTRVSIRKTFNRSDIKAADRLGLMINYDDGFVASLNGTEIVRRGVVGDGETAKVSSHEASGHELIEIENGISLLKEGRNVISLVGYNVSPTSSDFSLDPYLVYTSKEAQPRVADDSKSEKTEPSPLTKAVTSAFEQLSTSKYAAGSRRLVVFNRKTGEKLWHRDAVFNFRHNNIAVTRDRVFCIDRLTDDRFSALK